MEECVLGENGGVCVGVRMGRVTGGVCVEECVLGENGGVCVGVR